VPAVSFFLNVNRYCALILFCEIIFFLNDVTDDDDDDDDEDYDNDVNDDRGACCEGHNGKPVSRIYYSRK